MSLEEKWNDGFKQVWCKECNKVLVEFDSKGWLINECQHFRWKPVSILCFYDPNVYPECDSEYMKKLKDRYILRVDEVENLFLLVPRQVDEEARSNGTPP